MNELTLVLPSDCVSVWVDDGGIWGKGNAVWYVYTDRKSGKQFKIPSDSILHFRTSTSFDGIVGKPVREILADTLDGNMTAQKMLNMAMRLDLPSTSVRNRTSRC